MYPINNASPERIAVGAVVLIADGTVQTSGVSITVVPQGGASAAGGGTISYEQGVVFYLPTQAETNYSSFIVTAYKASCFPVSITIVTTQSATAGQVRLEGVTHTSAVIPTVSTVTDGAKASAISALNNFDPAADAVANVTLVATTTTNTDMRGTELALLAANTPANFSTLSINGSGIVDSFLQGFLNVGITESVAGRIADNFDTLFDNANVTSTLTLADILSVLADTNELQTNQANWNTATGFATEIKQDIIDANVDLILADTNELQTDDVPGLISSLNNVSVADLLTTQMTEGYAVDGTAPTLAQAIFLIQQSIGDFSISGTLITAKKLDGTSTAATYTLDDSANPTSRTRTT